MKRQNISERSSLLSPLKDTKYRSSPKKHPRLSRKAKTCRQSVWHVLHYRTSIVHKSCLERTSYGIEVFILNLILINVILTLWTSVYIHENEDQDELLKENIYYFSFLIFSVVVFSLEYFLRLWSCVEDRRFQHSIYGRMKWMIQPMSILDLMALIPFYLELFIEEEPYSYRGAVSIRALRLLRVLSFLRIERSYNAVKKLRKVFSKKREELLIVTYLTAVVILISSTTIFFLEYSTQPNVFKNVGIGAWWTVETITSLGYGDTVPITTSGKVFGSVVALWGIILFSIPGAILNSGFVEVMLEHQKEIEREAQERMIQSLNSQHGKELLSLLETTSKPLPTIKDSPYVSTQDALETPPFHLSSLLPSHISIDSTTTSLPISSEPKEAVSKIGREEDEKTKEGCLNESFHQLLNEKLNQIIENQRKLEIQIQSQKQQMEAVIYILQTYSLPTRDENEQENEEEEEEEDEEEEEEKKQAYSYQSVVGV